MPSVETLLTFTIAATILNLSPGPSNLYVMARSVGQGVKGGIIAAIGLAFGLMIHVLLAALGLSAVFMYSPLVYTFVKLTGAGYLIYLGLTCWKTDNSSTGPENISKNKTGIQIFRESILVEVTNPKTALFFIAFLPQFVVPGHGAVSWQIIIFGSIVTMSALPCDILIALSCNKISTWLSNNERTMQIQERVSGSILIGMGSYIVADEAIGFKAR